MILFSVLFVFMFVLVPLVLAWMTWGTLGIRIIQARIGIYAVYVVLTWNYWQVKH